MPSDLDRLKVEYADREHRLQGEDTYSLFNPANLFMLQGRQRVMLRLLRAGGFFPLSGFDILELGCGAGGVLLELAAVGAEPGRLHGVDVLPFRLAQARERLPVGVGVACADGQRLPFAAGSFDLVLQFTVFSSILDGAIRQALAQELLRVLRPGGAVLWYDFWLNPTNRQTRGIRPAEIRSLFPGCTVSLKRVTLAPPLVRRVAPWSPLLAQALEAVGFLNSHYLGLIRKTG